LHFHNLYSESGGLSAPFTFPKTQTVICRAAESSDTNGLQEKKKIEVRSVWERSKERQVVMLVCVSVCHDGLNVV